MQCGDTHKTAPLSHFTVVRGAGAGFAWTWGSRAILVRVPSLDPVSLGEIRRASLPKSERRAPPERQTHESYSFEPEAGGAWKSFAPLGRRCSSSATLETLC